MEIWIPYMPLSLALAVVAALGYLMGRRNQKIDQSTTIQARRELRRAKVVAQELETIAESLRKSLASHHSSIVRFKEQVSSISDSAEEHAWVKLCEEAEEMLKPTMQLASEISTAYDHIRQQTNHLMTFTEVRTDPLTGISNRRALDESMELMFAMLARYQRSFTISILDIDHFKRLNDTNGHLYGDRKLKEVAKLISDSARETDIVTRYGGEEFVIIMPHTNLHDAALFTDRLRVQIETKMKITISGGLAEAIDGDNPQSLLARADAALYGAKAGGRNLIYYHNGDTVVLVSSEQEESTQATSVQDETVANTA